MAQITTGVGSPGTVSSAGGGRTYAFNNISTTPQQVIGANPKRQSATFHNPGTVILYIAPAFVQNTGSDVALTPTTTALGGCMEVPAGGWITITGECQKPYQAFAASGSTNPLTVIDTNI
jgi:hypothetical protein